MLYFLEPLPHCLKDKVTFFAKRVGHDGSYATMCTDSIVTTMSLPPLAVSENSSSRQLGE